VDKLLLGTSLPFTQRVAD